MNIVREYYTVLQFNISFCFADSHCISNLCDSECADDYALQVDY